MALGYKSTKNETDWVSGLEARTNFVNTTNFTYMKTCFKMNLLKNLTTESLEICILCEG